MATISPAHLMHATLWRQPFTAEGWVFENKLDGFRALVRKTRRTVELLSRSGRSMADQFPDIIRAAQAIPGTAVLDAELVVLDDRGHAIFECLTRRKYRQCRPVQSIIGATENRQSPLIAVDRLDPACREDSAADTHRAGIDMRRIHAGGTLRSSPLQHRGGHSPGRSAR